MQKTELSEIVPDPPHPLVRCTRPACPISCLHITKGKSTPRQPVRYNRATAEATARIERPPKQGPIVGAEEMMRGVFKASAVSGCTSHHQSRLHIICREAYSYDMTARV